jgi:hypothetical protein
MRKLIESFRTSIKNISGDHCSFAILKKQEMRGVQKRTVCHKIIPSEDARLQSRGEE